MDRLEAALTLHKLGWNVVAAPRGGKSPLGAWKRWQEERIPERGIRDAFGDVAEHNLFVITGSVSRLLVLDCDDHASVEFWQEKLGDVMERTTQVRTGKGRHFYFRLPEGTVVRGTSSSDSKCRWDIRAEGGGVIAPPSVHGTGRVYRWVTGRAPAALQDAPGILGDGAPDQSDRDDGGPKSTLVELLLQPPREGERNVWLTRVAGHYAKLTPPGWSDWYDHHVDEAAAKLQPSLPEEEVYKLKQSIWNAELAKQGRLSPDVAVEGEGWREKLLQPGEHTGWLASGRTCILVQTRTGRGQEAEYALSKWMDADVRVLGVVESDRGRAYEVELLKGGDVIPDVLPSATLASNRELNIWLANHGVSIGPPDNAHPLKMREPVRLTRYLEAQEAETLEAADALGWHEPSKAFVTHDGVIRATGPGPHERVRPDPAVRGWAPYRYGFGGKEEAAAILGEVLTFHYEEVAAVFGSWWAACFLKPQISAVASQFPFMALEAASESGKTTGFFSIALQLAGNAGGHSNPTRAALRDYLSAHRSGIVWMDDLDSLENHGELLRNVTVGGAIIKKGEDNRKQVVAQMRAALVVSGESLGLHGQKALLDRAILLEVPSPTQRASLQDGARPQWDDILDLKTRHPDLTDYAGSIVQLALAQEKTVGDYKGLRVGSGRFADKLAVLRVGARILNGMLGGKGDWIVERVDRWAGGETDQGSENALTLRLLPLVLSRTGWKTKPEGPDPARRLVATPAFVESEDESTPIVWFSPHLLAAWWEREPPAGKKVDQRVESAEALVQQARALGLGGQKSPDGGRRTWRLVTGEGTQVYWRVPIELSRQLLERSRGEEQHGDDKSD